MGRQPHVLHGWVNNALVPCRHPRRAGGGDRRNWPSSAAQDRLYELRGANERTLQGDAARRETSGTGTAGTRTGGSPRASPTPGPDGETLTDDDGRGWRGSGRPVSFQK